jgi:hypothetical protein
MRPHHRADHRESSRGSAYTPAAATTSRPPRGVSRSRRAMR